MGDETPNSVSATASLETPMRLCRYLGNLVLLRLPPERLYQVLLGGPAPNSNSRVRASDWLISGHMVTL